MESHWLSVDAAVDVIVSARPGAYDPEVLESLKTLLTVLQKTGRPAPLVEAGYWPTFCLSWAHPDSRNLSIEVFGDRYEVYRFFDGRTDIWNEMRRPDRGFTENFLRELPPPV